MQGWEAGREKARISDKGILSGPGSGGRERIPRHGQDGRIRGLGGSGGVAGFLTSAPTGGRCLR